MGKPGGAQFLFCFILTWEMKEASVTDPVTEGFRKGQRLDQAVPRKQWKGGLCCWVLGGSRGEMGWEECTPQT